jgi:hypothetical protein
VLSLLRDYNAGRPILHRAQRIPEVHSADVPESAHIARAGPLGQSLGMPKKPRRRRETPAQALFL